MTCRHHNNKEGRQDIGQADSAQILRYIGEIYYQSGSNENAYQYYRMAVQANAADVDAQISMGQTPCVIVSLLL